MSRTVTIRDIAQKVGVSETTVSRYLNQKYEYMSEKTREKITKVIDELDYRPNNMARSLKSQKSKMIGAVIADISNPFSAITIKGLSDCCESMGYTLLIAISDDSSIIERKQIQNFLDNQVDGLIVNTAGGNDEYLNKLWRQNLPIVLLDRGISEGKIITVTTDNYQGVIDMMLFLIETGYKSIGFFGDEISNSVRRERLRGFEDILRLNNNDCQGVTYLNSSRDKKSISNSLSDFRKFPGPRVIFGANGLMTSTILEVMNSENYIINEDFGICGFDDLSWAKVVKPELTMIYQDSYSLGTESINQLVKIIEVSDLKEREKNSGKIILFPTELKIRNSTIVRQ